MCGLGSDSKNRKNKGGGGKKYKSGEAQVWLDGSKSKSTSAAKTLFFNF